MIAHRRPSFYLAPRGRDELDRMTDSHLRVLTQAGVIEAPYAMRRWRRSWRSATHAASRRCNRCRPTRA